MGEKELFSFKTLIDGIIIPAHFAAFYDPSLSLFLSDIKLPFLIDPMTYVCDPSNNMLEDNIKKSYQKYFDKLGIEPQSLNLQQIKIMDDTELDNFIDKFLGFQYNLTSSITPRKKSLSRIRSFEQKNKLEDYKPDALVPPYFHFRGLNDEIYALNLRIASLANNNFNYPTIDKTPCICFSRNLLAQQSNHEKIVDDYSFSKRVILWINNFDDRKIDINSLSYLKNLIELFSSKGIKTINLYGSYFSVILGYSGLDSFSSGICLSHKKAIDAQPTGGGLPLRYYEPTLKIEITNPDAFRLYSENPEMFSCNCPICKSHSEKFKELNSVIERSTLLDSLFLDSADKTRKAIMDWKNTRIHFLYSRKNEIEEQKILDKFTLKRKLEKDYKYLSSIDLEFIKTVSSPEHIRRWYDTIN